MKNNKKNIRNILILIIISILVLYFCLKDNFKETIEILLNVNIVWVLVGVILMVAYWFFRSISMCSITRKFKTDYKFSKAFRLVIETQFFHAITPFSSGGQPYEIYSLKREKINITDVTNITIQNFIVYQIALVLLGVVALISNSYLDLYENVYLLKKLIILGFLINTFVIVALFLLTFCKKLHKVVVKFIINFLSKLKVIKDKESIINNMEKSLSEFNDGAKKLLSDKKHFISMIFINFISLLILYMIPVILLYSLGDYSSFNIIEAIITSAYVMLIGSFVPIPGGSGGLEYAFIKFYGNFIISSKLNVIMILWRFLTYYLGMFVGAIMLALKKRGD